MTDDEAKEVVRLYLDQNQTITEIAKRFQVSKTWIYQILMGGKRGIEGVSEADVQRNHLRRNYMIFKDGLYKKCVECKVVKKVDKDNFYFYPTGVVKYSFCKVCQIAKVKKHKERKRGWVTGE